jgi:DNA polymerase-3 subunit alpha
MEKLVVEREANGKFATLDDLAHRVDPRLLNKRQLETLASAGAFDAFNPNRAGIHGAAETILATASRVQSMKASGQGGLFGGEDAAEPPIRLPNAHWALAERMEAEKEAYGFYFSAHPVDRHGHLARMHGARSFATLGELDIPDDGKSRAGATMAVLVEEARWRTSARGRRYLMATLSDPSGQFFATCFDDMVSADLEEAAREGACGLMTVELDRRPGEETPRVSVKRLQRFESLANAARFVLELTVETPAALAVLATVLADYRGARGEVWARAVLPEGGHVRLLLGRDFLLDQELATRIEGLAGISGVALKSSETRLALVG